MTGIWAATDEVARELAKSPHLGAFRQGLEPQPADPSQPFDIGSVQHLLVYYSLLQTQPLLVGLRLPLLPEFAPLHDSSPEVRGWFDIAQRFAFAFVDVMEFLRSRLPGYPMLSVPELSPGAPRVYRDGFWDGRFPWMADVRRGGLQLQARPAIPPRALGLPDGGTGLYDSLTHVLAALRESATWQRFVAADAGLGEEDRVTAKRLRKEYRAAVTEDRIDAIAGSNGMRGAFMRRAELEAVKAEADGALREYFEAFDGVDELLDGVAAFISHRIVRGDISEVWVISADWGPARDMRVTRLRARDSSWRGPYELIRVSSAIAALAGVVVLYSVSLFLDEDLLLADGRLLSHSSAIASAGP